MANILNRAILGLALTVIATTSALARGNDITIKDGFGEEVTIKHGLFGSGTKQVKDRLGNGYSTKEGWFGTKQTDVNVLGNTIKKKKGLLGGSQIEGSTIFGDKVQTKKGIFGRRTTTIDAGGTASVIRDLYAKHKDKLLGSAKPSVPKIQPPIDSLNSSQSGEPIDASAF